MGKKLIEAKLAKPAHRLCKDCKPVDWIKCYETRGKWKQCEKQAAQSRV
jgi:hypothetical protein